MCEVAQPDNIITLGNTPSVPHCLVSGTEIPQVILFLEALKRPRHENEVFFEVLKKCEVNTSVFHIWGIAHHPPPPCS